MSACCYIDEVGRQCADAFCSSRCDGKHCGSLRKCVAIEPRCRISVKPGMAATLLHRHLGALCIVAHAMPLMHFAVKMIAERSGGVGSSAHYCMNVPLQILKTRQVGNFPALR
jgi:hypothetical protein